MSTSDIRKKVRGLILGITGIIIALLFIRIVVDFLEAGSRSGFVGAIRDVTDIFIAPMDGIIRTSTASEIDQLNLTALLAIFIYFVAGLIFAEVITAFLYDNAEDILLNITDAAFKIVEFIFFLRIVFDLLRVNQIGFIKSVYNVTNWAEGAILDLKIVENRLDVSIILILIFIVILDIVSEGLLRGLLKGSSSDSGSYGLSGSGGGSSSQSVTHVHMPQMESRSLPRVAIKPAKPIQQNITVNIPAPAPQPVQRVAVPVPVQVPIPNYSIQPPVQSNVPRSQQVNYIAPVANTQPSSTGAYASTPIPQWNPNGNATFGQEYSVKSVPQRFQNATFYGVKPKKTKVKKTMKSRFKKLLGS